MKSRKVLLMVEVDTDLPLKALRWVPRMQLLVQTQDEDGLLYYHEVKPLQVQANVVRAAKATPDHRLDALRAAVQANAAKPRAKGKRGKR